MMPAPAAGGARSTDPDRLIETRRLEGRPLLLLLDIDGTLAPIAPHPSMARVPDETRRVIATLSARPGLCVVLVSGRAAHDARRLVGVEHLWTIGNHGAERMDPNGEITVNEAVSRYAGAIARAAHVLAPLIAPLRGVILENKTWTLSVHYRLVDVSLVPRLRAVANGIAAEIGLVVTEGKKVLEIRPPVEVNKGTAVVDLARELGGFDDDASVLFAGDDVTDEDAFRMLRTHHPRAVTILVGSGADSAAEFRLDDLSQVRTLLERIARETHTRQ